MPRFQQIDDTNRGDHPHVAATDNCYFLFEYTSGKGYSFSQTNQLISNLKKKPSQSRQRGYQYKGQAIARCSQLFASTINAAAGTLVPAPPSKVPGHPDYDDRILRICRGIPGADVREIVKQRESMEAAHESGAARPSVNDYIANYYVDEQVALPVPRAIAVIDDVLTAGTHWRALHHVLSERFPNVPIVGFFIARRVFPPMDPLADFDIVLP